MFLNNLLVLALLCFAATSFTYASFEHDAKDREQLDSNALAWYAGKNVPTQQPSKAPSAPPTKLNPIELGAAAHYAILAGSTITSTGVIGTVVTGDIGVFPGSAITGFPPAILNGAADSANTASGLAQLALTQAYNKAAGLALTATLSNTDLGGVTLPPGVYKFDAAAAMNGVLTLDALGDKNAVWVFQIGTALLLTLNSAVRFKDSIGNPEFVYWQVGTSATLEINSFLQGTIMALASISVKSGASVLGRLLARNAAVTMDFNTVTIPANKVRTRKPSRKPSKRPSAVPSKVPSKAPVKVPTKNAA